jgi:hypothetical protein
VAMSKWDHEQLAVTVEWKVHGGVQLLDGLCQAGRLHCGERARPCVDLRALVAASTALCQTYITRKWQYYCTFPTRNWGCWWLIHFAYFHGCGTSPVEAVLSYFYGWENSPVERKISYLIGQ